MDFNNVSQEQFLKNVNALQVRDAKKRMRVSPTNSLYSTTNDDVLTSDSSTDRYIRSKIWL